MTELRAYELRDIVQIDPRVAPTQYGGCLLVVTEVYVGKVVGYLPAWGMQQDGLVYLSIGTDLIRHTGGRVFWDMEQDE